MVVSSQYQIYKNISSVKMSQWHARIAHMAMHMNMVQGPLGPPKSGTGMVAT